MKWFGAAFLAGVLVTGSGPGVLFAQGRPPRGLAATVHNLGPGGPGRARVDPESAKNEGQQQERRRGRMCVYCHTPHNATVARGLWNREMQPVRYKTYSSAATRAEIGQPTGSSRLCLSCHDGVIALGALKHHPEKELGRLSGPTVLGTDLSDDHPISFVYDEELAAARGELVDPKELDGAVRLDENHEMQCTSCHDPHSNRYPNFLVGELADSELCVSCHELDKWHESSHATSSATGGGTAELPGWGFDTVAQNGCSSCHQTHGAAHPEYLLRAAVEEDVCMACHDGSVAAKDLSAELSKRSAHRVDLYEDVHDPVEDPMVMDRHVECADCHNAHQASVAVAGTQVPGPVQGVPGIDVERNYLEQASAEHQICLRCHGVAEAPRWVVQRDDNVTNVRLEIHPTNPSFHPIADVGRNTGFANLIPPLSRGSRIECTDCHDSDTAASATGNAPRGPHGSMYEPILRADYRLEAVPGPETYQLYELCYRCHNRDILLAEGRQGFPHRLHVSEVGASCATCHDAHGSRENAYLINFMTRDVNGDEVVTASSSGALEYQSLGAGSGRCSLTCHGFDHAGTEYPLSGVLGTSMRRGRTRR